MEKGLLAFVLHAHLPFVRHPEHEDSLEEKWLYEAITDTYLQLLFVLEGLCRDGIDFRLTLSVSPTLASMLVDPFLQSRYLNRLDALIELGKKEIDRTQQQPELNGLARMYHHRLVQAREAFAVTYDRDLVRAFAGFEDKGCLELMASSATHGYLPLLAVHRTAVRAQVRVGLDTHEELFGRRPAGFWLPECGYYPGVDELLAREGIRYTVLETHGITRAEPRPRNGVYAPLYCPSGVAAFGRDPESSKQVWSATEGYPGDWDYREFYRDIAYDLDLNYLRPYIHCDGIRLDTGYKYFRITGQGDRKALYVPRQAEQKAQIHAEHFVAAKESQIVSLQSVMDRPPLIVAPYDAELFGHWWYEGPKWLDSLIRELGTRDHGVRLTTPSQYLRAYPANQLCTPAVSSWGAKGFHGTWLNEKNDWIYPALHDGAEMMEGLARRHKDARGISSRALRQAGRELLLAQASDWAFMISAGTMAGYGAGRTRTHLSRLARLCREMESQSIDRLWLAGLENQDNIFPRINCDYFNTEA